MKLARALAVAASLLASTAWLPHAPPTAAAAAKAPAPAAKAPAATADAKKKAKALYLAAEDAFKAGRYDEASDLYRRAYDAFPDPIFVYNVAQCLRLSGKDMEALAAYRAYLVANPDAPNRADAEALIVELEKRIGAAPKPIDATPPPASEPAGTGTGPAPAPTPPRRPSSLVPGIGLAAFGGVLLGLSAWTGSRTVAALEEFENAPLKTDQEFVDALALRARFRGFRAATTVLVVVGGAAVLGGGTLLVLSLAGRRAETGVTLTPGGAPGLGVSLTLRPF